MMTDLEMTKLCAQAMDIVVSSPMTSDGSAWTVATTAHGHPSAYLYDPINDDAQVMKLEDWLIERGELSFGRNTMIYNVYDGGCFQFPVMNKQMRRRAVVEFVARMWASKSTPQG